VDTCEENRIFRISPRARTKTWITLLLITAGWTVGIICFLLAYRYTITEKVVISLVMVAMMVWFFLSTVLSNKSYTVSPLSLKMNQSIGKKKLEIRWKDLTCALVESRKRVVIPGKGKVKIVPSSILFRFRLLLKHPNIFFLNNSYFLADQNHKIYLEASGFWIFEAKAYKDLKEQVFQHILLNFQTEVGESEIRSS